VCVPRLLPFQAQRRRLAKIYGNTGGNINLVISWRTTAHQADFSPFGHRRVNQSRISGTPLVLNITPKLAVNLAYGGPRWTVESERRQADATKAF
jgi:hypothetical protein